MKNIYSTITRQLGLSYLVNAALFLVGPLLIFILTHTLTVAEYGVYSILAITVSVGGVILDLGLSQYVLSQLAGVPARQRTRAFTSLLGGLIIVLILALGAALFTPVQGALLEALKLTDYAAAFSVALAIILCTTLIRIFAAYFTAQAHIVTANVIFLMGQGLWVIILLGAYAWTSRLTILSVMVWWFVGALLTLLFCSWRVRKEFTHFESIRSWGKQFWTALVFGLPLLMLTIGSWTIEIADRYMLNSMVGSEAVGLYTLSYSILGVVTALGTIVALTFFPYLAAAWNRRRDYQVYLNASVKYSLIALLPAMGGFLALREGIITLVSGRAYLPAAGVVPVLIAYPLLSVLSYILYQMALLQKRTVRIGAVYAAGALLNIILNLALIPRMNIAGAAIATVISYAFVTAALAWTVRDAFRVDLRFLKLGRVLAATAIMTAAVWAVVPTHALSKIATIIAGATLYFGLLLPLKVFSEKERSLLRRVLPPTMRRLVP